MISVNYINKKQKYTFWYIIYTNQSIEETTKSK